jgi:tryptophan-rich sensory protein
MVEVAPFHISVVSLDAKDISRMSTRVTSRGNSPRYVGLIGFLAATFAAAAIGSAATFTSVKTWYPLLEKPSWTPPGWLFAPVWSALYVAMAVAGWRVWRNQTGSAARAVLRLYAAQLALNALWSVLFFGLRRPDLALIDIAGLWLLLILALFHFWRADWIAGALWTPYVLWVSCACGLNAAIWMLNSG